MLLCIFAIFIAIIAGATIAWYMYFFNWRWRVKGAMGPTPIPILGNALKFHGNSEMLSDFNMLIQRYGKVVPLMVGISPEIIVADYDVFEHILSSSQYLAKSEIYRYVENWLNQGLITSDPVKWRKRRKILTPTFHFQIIEKFVPIFDRVSNTLIEQLRKNDNLDSIDLCPYIKLYALDVICETAMGVSINAQQNNDSEYVSSVNSMGKIVMERFVSPLQQSNLTYWLTKNYRIEKKSLNIIHKFSNSMIEKRRRELEMEDDRVDEETETPKRDALLDFLLKATEGDGVPLTDADIREEVDTFMFAGHDTIASAVVFTLYSIANHPDVYGKVVDEQNYIFGNNHREITHTDLNQMRYLEMVIKESLRLYPPVPLIGRKHGNDINLDNGITIPAGTNITLLIFFIHRDSRFFPNPEKFDPDRFLFQSNASKQPYSFLPFSAGPRNCIGQKLAMLELKATISKIVHNFKLSPSIPYHQLQLSFDTVLKSDNGIRIKMLDRT